MIIIEKSSRKHLKSENFLCWKLKLDFKSISTKKLWPGGGCKIWYSSVNNSQGMIFQREKGFKNYIFNYSPASHTIKKNIKHIPSHHKTLTIIENSGRRQLSSVKLPHSKTLNKRTVRNKRAVWHTWSNIILEFNII